MFDFKWGNVLDGFWKIESQGYNRKLSGYSQYGSAADGEINPLNNDYGTAGSTPLNLNQFITNCTPSCNPYIVNACAGQTVVDNSLATGTQGYIKAGGGLVTAPTVANPAGTYYGGTNPTGYVPGTYQTVNNSYTTNGYRALQTGCGVNQPQSTTYYDPTNPRATNPYHHRRDLTQRTFFKSQGDMGYVALPEHHAPG